METKYNTSFVSLVQQDMLTLVWERRPSYNNNTRISTNPFITYIKLIYYTIFAILYGLVGSLSDLTMVNSSWTKGHIARLWRLAGKIHVIYPPVDTASLSKISLDNRENMVLSIGQFRPEKDHVLQLKAFKLLLDRLEEDDNKNDRGEKMIPEDNVKLILIGSCRGEDDEERVDNLQKLSRELVIQDRVEFVLNQPYSILKEYLSRASVGIHTMWNEHFGIGVVEMMAAGLVTVAHDSGGPKSDIIVRPWDLQEFAREGGGGKRPTGCLASTAEEYADAMYTIIKRGAGKEVAAIRQSGRNASERFSDDVFMKSLKETMLASSLLR
jgi:alpha-1,2-mannosyltransferase